MHDSRCAAAASVTPPPSSKGDALRWAGTYGHTWDDGVCCSSAYTIAAGGRSATLAFKSGDGNAKITGSAACDVHGAVAVCKFTNNESDNDKKVVYDETTTFTFFAGASAADDSISYSSEITKSTVTFKDGRPCPDPVNCTGLHVGAKGFGSDKRGMTKK